jgi:putative DNA primase/helicase
MDKQRVLDGLNKETFYSREVPSIKWNGKAEGLGLCPFHDDRNPSFSANREDGTWYCHACRKGGSVFDFYRAQHGGDFRGALESLGREAGVDLQDQGPAKKKGITPALGRIIAEYDYTDESGVMLYQALRYEPKTFRQRKPDVNGRWIWNLDRVRLVPYHLPEVLKAKSVIVVEGEKDVETLEDMGLTATTNAQGAGKWRQEYNEHLRGKRVVVLPDNDEPGRKHAQDVARNLRGIAEIVKVVELPGLPHKGDVSDWIKQSGTKEQLVELIKQAPEWTPPAEFTEEVDAPAPRIRVVNIADFLAMEFPPRENLLSPILPTQGLVMVHAFRGVGKTHISLGIAVAVASGGTFFRWEATKPQGVLFLDGEMPAVTIKERLSYSIVNAEKELAAPLYIVTPDLQEHGTMPDLSTAEGQLDLEPYLEDVSLVIVDNISTLCRTGRENEAEGWLPVQSWALRLRARGKSVLFVVHEGKGGTQRGTSKREDVLDTVIRLKRPGDYRQEEGARFEVHYEKHRGFYGDDAKPFEARLIQDANGKHIWTMKDMEDSLGERVMNLINEGLDQKDIAVELGISPGYVSKLKKKAQE